MHYVNVYVKPVALASVTRQNFSLKFENASIGTFSRFAFNIRNAFLQALLQQILTLLINFVNSYSGVEILLKSFTNQQ